MSIATQLLDVGYKPTKKYKTSREELARNNHNLELIQMSERQERLDGWVPKPRVIQFQRAGSHVKARYQGGKTFVIGEDRKQAAKRLEFLAAEGRA